MPAKNATTESGGFSAEERAAMKMRAAELRAEGKKGRQEGRRPARGPRQHRRDGTGRARARRARACDCDRPRALAEDLVRDVRCADADAKIVVFFQDAGEFSYRCSSASWRSMRTSIGSATSAAPRASSSDWPNSSAEGLEGTVHPKHLPGTRARPPMGQGHHLRRPFITESNVGCAVIPHDRRLRAAGARGGRRREGAQTDWLWSRRPALSAG
jgi:hypothetical protein